MANCSSCGSRIPDGQGRSCSMCYGDPGWGKDGYYQQWIEDQQRAEEEKNRAESEQAQEDQERWESEQGER